MPLQVKPAAQLVKPPSIPSPGNNSFLGEVFTSDAPKGQEITSGFYRQEAGEPLVYTYTYDEMKIVLEVEGEFTITDETGHKIIAKPGDVLFFPKGSTITFATTGYALNFYTGLRGAGEG
ncbi:uncharacterized protein SPAPADRAFT_63356 [Spathaspora passalidarum NRRL Y-27907]|uniref:(S)-ureidoglycine aminohydrolase cupin domain-containing protein n=1 Tax=Spathaspora passalidarum (strain NRRL Y-27907 / 11-Y1) TaxID=619300 RepID=G3AUE4_SPAPN|nr:uncharacterized protein SPAPADRAFT_63356 [Spathaspora passalidarum NRRL Y-27907]EGW30520.1 hypothetical protein SPAPADRAFT_63356 [Spathaspora passalidarum NRRL Y-27907]